MTKKAQIVTSNVEYEYKYVVSLYNMLVVYMMCEILLSRMCQFKYSYVRTLTRLSENHLLLKAN